MLCLKKRCVKRSGGRREDWGGGKWRLCGRTVDLDIGAKSRTYVPHQKFRKSPQATSQHVLPLYFLTEFQYVALYYQSHNRVDCRADRFVPVPDKEQFCHALLCTLSCQTSLCILIPTVLHRLLQRTHRLRETETE